ncbi:MAG: hypothetical protein K2H59_00525 [Muribaculaceae bacterium]|nr:hypothetical protein [Muribaculaceae bacterium]
MQININDTTFDIEFKKASKYLPIRLSTTYFDGIGECICIVANRADGDMTEIVEYDYSEVFITLYDNTLYSVIKNLIMTFEYWTPNTHYNTVNGFADGLQRKIHLDGGVF